jgi:hypothetical protein
VELDLVSFYRIEIQLNIELWAGYFRAPYCLVCLILGECVAGDNCPNRTHVLFFVRVLSASSDLFDTLLHAHLLTSRTFLEIFQRRVENFGTILSHSVSPLRTFNFSTPPRHAAYTASPARQFVYDRQWLPL